MTITLDRELETKQADSNTPDKKVSMYKRRMLLWPNPVEFVNNMYASHPGDDDREYFAEIFRE
jgi:hypothetical protein